MDSLSYSLNEQGSTLSRRNLLFVSMMEITSVLFFTLFPLLFNLPYRDNLYLSWEGTYRLYMGQMPYIDFGMPIGYGYFIIPLIFFKLFGPFMRTLLYAQVFINLLTLFVFREIFRKLGLNPIQLLLTVLVFTVSYTFSFFWPWYNNTALFYQLVGIYFIISLPNIKSFKYYTWIFFAAMSTFLSFFTKQDYGGVALMMSIVLVSYTSYHERDWQRIVLFGLAYALSALIFIYPFLGDEFIYWFNYGQAPHQSRLNIGHFLGEFLGNSMWEKFYLFLMVLLFIDHFNGFKRLIEDRSEVLIILISFGFVFQNLITKVTSRLPLESTMYFHGFAFAYVVSHVNIKKYSKNIFSVVAAAVLIVTWWSATYWKYANRMFHFTTETKSLAKSNKVNPPVWKAAPFSVYTNVDLPQSTIDGISRIKKMSLLKKKGKDLKVLNMSELTPLAHEINYTPKGKLPLWYHLNIGMFQKQVDEINLEVKNNYYDLVLFEVVPGLDNFYPFEVRDQLKMHYKQVDSFLAPRKEGDSHIEVFIKK